MIGTTLLVFLSNHTHTFHNLCIRTLYWWFTLAVFNLSLDFDCGIEDALACKTKSTYIHTYMHTYIHTCMHTYISIYPCIHTCIRTWTKASYGYLLLWRFLVVIVVFIITEPWDTNNRIKFRRKRVHNKTPILNISKYLSAILRCYY